MCVCGLVCVCVCVCVCVWMCVWGCGWVWVWVWVPPSMHVFTRVRTRVHFWAYALRRHAPPRRRPPAPILYTTPPSALPCPPLRARVHAREEEAQEVGEH